MFENFFEPASSTFAVTLYVIILITLILCVLFIILFSLKSKQLSDEMTNAADMKSKYSQSQKDLLSCKNDKITCDTSLTQCSSDKDQCENSLKSLDAAKLKCQTDISICQEKVREFDSVKSSLAACSSRLSLLKNAPTQIPSNYLNVSASSSYDNEKNPISKMIDGTPEEAITNDSGNQWMLVTLKKSVPITKIEIDTSSVAGRMLGVILEIIDDSNKIVYKVKIENESKIIYINPQNVVGRYIKLTQPNKNYLALAEIRIFTTPEYANSYSS